MKVINIERDDKNIYLVTIKPNFIKRLFGAKNKLLRLKDSGRAYAFGNQTVYINEKGEQLGNHCTISKKIDNWRRRF